MRGKGIGGFQVRKKQSYKGTFRVLHSELCVISVFQKHVLLLLLLQLKKGIGLCEVLGLLSGIQ